MTSPAYRVTKLAPSFDLRAFDCGEPGYNEWLVQHAANAVEAGSSMVYLLLQQAYPGTEELVAGYYAICPTVVVRDDMPKSLQRGVLRAAPAWLLAKLALTDLCATTMAASGAPNSFARHWRRSWPASTWAVAR